MSYPSLLKRGVHMSDSNKHSHLTKQERKIIQSGIENGARKSEIAATLGKDKSTIGKEIRNHRVLSHHNSYPTDCSRYQKCKSKNSCDPKTCDSYIPFKCSRRDRSPGACNRCSDTFACRYDKYYYYADTAEKEYREVLVDSRLGVDMTFSEAKELGDKIKPLLDQGQSPYQIVVSHPEFGICEKTLYNYIEAGVFSMSGISNIDLRRKVGRKMTKKETAVFKKREDKKYLKGRTYEDYKSYIKENPLMSVVEMDTVYNDVTNGPFLQTFEFVDYGFTFILLHNTKTADDMVSGIDKLEAILGHDLFIKHVQILLTDRGGEFVKADEIECLIDGSRRTRIFYCDPMRASQKAHLENSHREIRYICPKETDLRELGLTDQDSANLITSHVNSFQRETLKGKTPIEMMKFLSPELYERFNIYGIQEIEKDKVILKPYLLKK